MKKLVIIALAFFTITGFAQTEKAENNKASTKERMAKRANMSPEDLATIRTKQMALKLDLTSDQQIKIEEVLLSHFNEEQKNEKLNRKAIKEMTDEQRRDMKINRLDGAIALKQKMKSILDAEQYAKYSEMLKNTRDKGNRMGNMRRQ